MSEKPAGAMKRYDTHVVIMLTASNDAILAMCALGWEPFYGKVVE